MRIVRNKNITLEKINVGCHIYNGDIYAQLKMKRDESIQLLPMLKIIPLLKLSKQSAVYFYDTHAIL